MPGDPSTKLFFFLSGDGTGLGSLGGARSSNTHRPAEALVSTAASAGALEVELDNVGSFWEDAFPDQVQAYFTFGNAGGFQTRLVDAAVGTPGTISLFDPLPAGVSIGDRVYAFKANQSRMLYHDTPAQESGVGFTHYLGLYARISGPIDQFGFYLEEDRPGPIVHEIAASNDVAHVLTTIANTETAPDLSGMMQGGGQGRFLRPLAAGARTPGVDIVGLQNLGFWLKRTGPANAFRQSLQTTSIVGYGIDAGQPIFTKWPLLWNTAGFTPLLTLEHAPTVYQGGGARFLATVTSQELGQRVPDVPVLFELVQGDGVLQIPQPAETDENGEAIARYTASNEPGDVGQAIKVRAGV